MSRKILVTGAAGFIGGNLCKKLMSAGYDVRGIDNLSAGTMDNLPAGMEFHQIDIRSENIFSFFKKIDFVFHLAAKNCLIDCLNDPLETGDININGTINVLEAAKKYEVEKLIYADSSAVYEGVFDFPSKVEYVKPVGAYAVSKHSGALFTKMYADFFDLNVTILRYFNVYGPAQDYRRVIPPVISSFILKLLRRERPLIYGKREKRRDFIHVDDVNEFHLTVIKDRRTDGNIYNVGTGMTFSVLEILDMVSEALGVEPDPFYVDELPGEALRTEADISREKELGWEPRIDIKQGINDSINYLRRKVESESRAYGIG